MVPTSAAAATITKLKGRCRRSARAPSHRCCAGGLFLKGKFRDILCQVSI